MRIAKTLPILLGATAWILSACSGSLESSERKSTSQSQTITNGESGATPTPSPTSSPTPSPTPHSSSTPTPSPTPLLTPTPPPGSVVITPSRLSCVAEPCAVMFTTNGSIADQYDWNFGDGQTAHGFQTGHIFEQPGSYHVSLSIKSATSGQVTSAPGVDIQVQPFSGSTLYFDSVVGSDANPGTSPSAPRRTLIDAQCTNCRMLLARGSVFSTNRWINRGVHLSHVRLGAYGNVSLPMPVVQEASNAGFGATQSPLMDLAWASDVVIQDIAFKGFYQYVYKNPLSPYGHFYQRMAADLNPGTDHVVFLRVEISNLGGGISSYQIAPDIQQNLFIHDSYIHHTNSFHVFGQARGYSLQNNRLEYASNFHLQYAHTDDAIIVGNAWKGSGVNIVDPNVNPPVVWYQCGMRITEANGRIYVAGNTFTEISGAPICIGQSATPTHRTNDVLIEKNLIDGYFPANLDHWYDGGAGGISGGSNVIVRNNIFFNPRGPFTLDSAGENFPPFNVQIINNTFESSSGRTNDHFIRLSNMPSGAHDLRIANNLFHGTFGGTYGIDAGVMDFGFGAVNVPGLDIDHNLYDRTNGNTFFRIQTSTGTTWDFPQFSAWQSTYGFDVNSINGVDPLLVSLNPLNVAFMKLSPGSPAINRGATAAVFDDFYNTPRPFGSLPDIGATEF